MSDREKFLKAVEAKRNKTTTKMVAGTHLDESREPQHHGHDLRRRSRATTGGEQRRRDLLARAAQL
jgi:hypothetical protein